MDPLSDKNQYLTEWKQNELMVNIITHLSVLSRIIEKEKKILIYQKNNLKSYVEINYLYN